MALPLKHKQPIDERLHLVAYFSEHADMADAMREQIKQIGDLERLISKAAIARVSPREINQLKRALLAIVPIKKSCSGAKDKVLKKNS